MKANGIDVKATIYAKCIQKSGDCSWTEHDLQVGAYYKVEKIDMGQSYTSIYLEEFFRVYNSVYFEFYENGKEIDIYKDKRFNPYIQDESFDCGYHEYAKEKHEKRVAENPDRIAFAIKQFENNNIEYTLKNEATGHFHCRRKSDDKLFQFYAGTGKIVGVSNKRGIHEFIKILTH